MDDRTSTAAVKGREQEKVVVEGETGVVAAAAGGSDTASTPCGLPACFEAPSRHIWSIEPDPPVAPGAHRTHRQHRVREQSQAQVISWWERVGVHHPPCQSDANRLQRNPSSAYLLLQQHSNSACQRCKCVAVCVRHTCMHMQRLTIGSAVARVMHDGM
jgi:hypothetical protein